MASDKHIHMHLNACMETLRLSDESYRPKKFKIGLDYGTTFSAGAFCLCSGSTTYLESGRIYPFYGYPSELNDTKSNRPELPSDIRYESGGIIKIGYDAVKWHSSPGRSITRAKLGLEDRPETASARRTLTRDIGQLASAKTPVQVISDYLAELFPFFKEQLIRVGYDPRDSIELNCAVPSIWSQTARHSMIRAIEQAGRRSEMSFDPLIRLWPEAEAAMEHVVDEHPNLNLEKGDVFVICDAGGGTVDFTTYAVQNPEPLCLREVVEGSGALCGSTFLDEKFNDHIERRVRGCSSLIQKKSPVAIQKQVHRALNYFQFFIKPGFTGLGNAPHSIPFAGLPEDERNGFHEDEIVIEGKELLLIFEEVANEIWENLRSQIHKAERNQHHIKLVIFTGGLSQSTFMRKFLGKKLATEAQNLGRDNTIRFEHAQTADYSVASGAIRCSLKADNDTRTRRINSTSIGIAYSDEYDSKNPIHNKIGVKKVQDDVDKRYYVKNVILWILVKGEEQPKQKTIKLHEVIPENTTGEFEITIPLYACDHVCEDLHPLTYYQANSQECYDWETVTFAIDMSIIKARLKPQVIKGRKPKRAKASHTVGQTRRSARLNGANETTSNIDSLQPTNSGAGSGAVDTPCRETLSHVMEAPAAQVNPDDEGSDPEKFFKIDYHFTMEFLGLIAKYEFRCEAARYSRKGSVRLPESLHHENEV